MLSGNSYSSMGIQNCLGSSGGINLNSFDTNSLMILKRPCSPFN